ncbi:MAG TPA: XRE family transcriptional regulator [Pseudonocardiaceae bacterium]|jgi:transcriptional regulator with XRE-family HTH domain|nr:XRE family transcriptional regulator [Pseudonocardiaceae bacterium]
MTAQGGTPTGAPLALIARSIRRERDRVGISLSELAKRAGIAKSTLSQLESATGNPSVETLWALGVALGVPFSRLVDPPRTVITVVRAGEGPVFHSERANYAATMLSACPPGARRDIYVVRAGPGVPKESDPHGPGTVEHVWIGAGKALVGPAGELVELCAGDYATYPGDVPHVFEATEPGTTGMIVMEHV